MTGDYDYRYNDYGQIPWDVPNGYCGQCGAPINAHMVGGYRLHQIWDHSVPWCYNASVEQIEEAIAVSLANAEALKAYLKQKKEKQQ